MGQFVDIKPCWECWKSTALWCVNCGFPYCSAHVENHLCPGTWNDPGAR